MKLNLLRSRKNQKEENKRIHSIDTMPLLVFIKIMDTGNITGMVIEGKYTDDEVSEAWDELQNRYSDLVGGQSVIDYMIKSSRVVKAQSKLNALVGIQTIWFLDKKFCNEKLKELGVRAKNLKQLNARIHNTKNQLEIHLKELTEDTDKKTDYYELIAIISQNTGANIDIQKDTLRMFSSHLKTYLNKVKETERQNARR